MGSALFTGVTGLQAHQRSLDVVAANIANVNTTGYRSSRMLFQDLFSQTLAGGAAAAGAYGGTNPQQIGLGTTIASIDVDYGQGSLMTTGTASDFAIQGSGFFVLRDTSGSTNVYTRDGSFSLNANGELIEPGTGMRVQGFQADENGMIEDDALLTSIFIPVGGQSIVQATSVATMTGNLNSDVTSGDTVTRTIEVYDSLGTSREVTLVFTKTATDNEWTWEATYFDGTSDVTVGGGLATDVVTFDANGTISSGASLSITIPAATLGGGTDTAPSDLTFVVNMTDVTQMSAGYDSTTGDPATSDIAMRTQDGFERGVLESYNIGDNGEIIGVFTNGLTRNIAQVALATFSNVGGLSRDGDNAFVETPASGTAQIGTPGTGGRGTVSGGVLENSNVDLGEEFSNLIITQRGYQANARTITAADTILQETVNLVR